MLLRSRIASHLGPFANVTLIDTIPMIRTSQCHSQVSFQGIGAAASGRLVWAGWCTSLDPI
jgi:hypothetical protein